MLAQAVIDIWRKRVVYVSRDGISGPNRKLMRWSDITEVDGASARSPLGYLAVRSHFAPAILVPKSAARDPRFRAAILGHAPAGNPLLVAIKDHSPTSRPEAGIIR
jgi:hypothetical protein